MTQNLAVMRFMRVFFFKKRIAPYYMFIKCSRLR